MRAKDVLPADVFNRIDNVMRAYSTLLKVLEGKNVSIRRLRRMLFGPRCEKSREVLASREQSEGEGNENTQAHGRSGKAKPSGPPPPGHGRNGQDAYRGAEKELVAHHALKPGDLCRGCLKGKVYEQRERPGILVNVTGRPPLSARVYHLQKLRCNLCLEIFEARPPAGVVRRKYDETAASMIAIFKYGGGFPWSRLHKLQDAVGVPLPPSTQWEVVRDACKGLLPAYEELERQAAQGKLLHNDDTTMRILAWMGKRREASLRDRSKAAADGGDGEVPNPDRTGTFTSGILSRVSGRQIALFFTGVRHAGENLKYLLDKRDRGMRPPIQMCDALSRNIPKNFKTILANCLAHGRRQFVELAENFPRECEHVLGILAKVYKNDAIAEKRKMTDAERLRFHQAKSAPLMEKLHTWMQAQIAEKKVEPNSGLGEAIGYMLKHWGKLTLFLKKAGAPLDNNICERALKKVILHRKNSLFYKTDNGARVGDVYMSLIHTCDLAGADPFDYLTQLQRHADEVRTRPELWMPWNYRKAVTRGRSP
ncbi:MAG: IS66 family transposase [Pseudomonadota bacterium]